MEAQTEQAISIALEIIAGADLTKYPRVSSRFQPEKESEHARRLRERQQAWLEKNGR